MKRFDNVSCWLKAFELKAYLVLAGVCLTVSMLILHFDSFFISWSIQTLEIFPQHNAYQNHLQTRYLIISLIDDHLIRWLAYHILKRWPVSAVRAVLLYDEKKGWKKKYIHQQQWTKSALIIEMEWKEKALGLDDLAESL